MRTSELARAAGITVRTVRHYHQIGVLAEPVRTANGYRLYSIRDLVRVLRIRQLSSRGIALDDVRAVLDRESGIAADEILERISARLDAQISALQEQKRS